MKLSSPRTEKRESTHHWGPEDGLVLPHKENIFITKGESLQAQNGGNKPVPIYSFCFCFWLRECRALCWEEFFPLLWVPLEALKRESIFQRLLGSPHSWESIFPTWYAWKLSMKRVYLPPWMLGSSQYRVYLPFFCWMLGSSPWRESLSSNRCFCSCSINHAMNTPESSEHKRLGLLCFLEIEKEISRQLHTPMLAVIFCT